MGLVRAVLKSGAVLYSACDVEYLRKYGEWVDIPLILSAVERPNYGASLLLFGEDSHFVTAAKAIYQIGKSRLGDLLKMTSPPPLTSKIIKESSDKNFRALDDSIIHNLLLSEHDVVRKATAIKCIRSLKKSRLESILANYTEADNYRYYNVIHWLDFGISVPRDRSMQVAGRLLAKM